METKQITIIPRKTPNQIDIDTGVKMKKRVCAYARVSTDLEDQKNSFEAQLIEYESRIKKNPNWTFIKLYSDEGITGTSIKHRTGFQEMINDALDGKIDLILTKSISRFARNTVDCLQTVRELLAHGVIVQFEKENLTTADSNIEMALTIYASMAQEESKSISENVKWGVRSRMKRGVVHYYKNILGYDKLDDGTIVINEDEKKIILEMYNLYIAGYTIRQICKIMEERNYKTGLGKTKWCISYVADILQNEKYCGDVLLQKTVCRDFLTHKREKNNGYEQQYLISNNHEAIVTREMFEYVKTIRKYRAENRDTKQNFNWNPFANITYCEHCFRHVQMVTTHPKTPSENRVLTCKSVPKRNENYVNCASKPLNYDLALKALTEAYFKCNEIDQEALKLVLESLSVDQSIFNKYYEKKQMLIELIEGVKDKMKDLIKRHILTPLPDYDLQYQNLKQKIIEYETMLEEHNKNTYQNNEEWFRQYRIAKFILDNETITIEIVRQCIAVIIKRKDNSLRFVVCKTKLSDEEKRALIPFWLSVEADMTGMVMLDDKTLKYDIVNYGGR